MARLYVVGAEGSAGKVGTERALRRVQAKGKESAEGMTFAHSTAAARERERNAQNAGVREERIKAVPTAREARR